MRSHVSRLSWSSPKAVGDVTDRERKMAPSRQHIRETLPVVDRAEDRDRLVYPRDRRSYRLTYMSRKAPAARASARACDVAPSVALTRRSSGSCRCRSGRRTAIRGRAATPSPGPRRGHPAEPIEGCPLPGDLGLDRAARLGSAAAEERPRSSCTGRRSTVVAIEPACHSSASSSRVRAYKRVVSSIGSTTPPRQDAGSTTLRRGGGACPPRRSPTAPPLRRQRHRR